MVGPSVGSSPEEPMGSLPEDENPAYAKPWEFQKHFGLSRSGLRLYENAGIFTPLRNSSNNYRVITMSNGVRMSLALTFARFGVPLKDAGRLVSDCTDDEELALLRERDDELNREALALVAKRARLEEHVHHLERFKSDPLACELVTGCDLYLLGTLNRELKFNSNQPDATGWWANAPFVTAGALATLDAEGNDVDMVHGPLATGDDVREFGLLADNAVHFCTPDRRYLTGYTVVPSEDRPTRQTYAHLFDYASNNGIELDGSQVLHRLLRCRNVDDVPMRYDLVYIPVVE